MSVYSTNDIVLVRYPFSDLQVSKVRPAIIVSALHISQDVFIVPLTSRITNLLPGEFVLENWKESGLNLASTVKRGIYTIHQSLIFKKPGCLAQNDQTTLIASLRRWLNLK
jgi:mRNA interferase MazF